MSRREKGKAKRVRKPPPKTAAAAAKKEEEPSKKEQRKQAFEKQKTQEAAGKRPFTRSSHHWASVGLAPPAAAAAAPPEEEERRVPLIQSRSPPRPCRSLFLSSLAEEPLYEEEGPRRAKPNDKTPRLSQAKLDVISENQSSKSLECIAIDCGHAIHQVRPRHANVKNATRSKCTPRHSRLFLSKSPRT